MAGNGSSSNGGVRVVDVALSLIRTYVPVAVVAVLAAAGAHWHIVLSDRQSATVTVWLVAAATAGYYAAARWLESRQGTGRLAGLGRWLGRWMLGGSFRIPLYIQPGELRHVRVVQPDGTIRKPS